MIGSRPRQERMDEVFDLFPDLRNMLKQPAGTLSGGESRMVACGRALDAGSQGPAPRRADGRPLAPVRRPLHGQDSGRCIEARGVAIVLAEQNATKALQVADRVMVLSLGEAHAVMNAADVTTQQLKEGYRI